MLCGGGFWVGVGGRGVLFLGSVWGDEGGGVFLGGRQAGPGLDYLRFLFGNQRLSVWFDVSGNRHLTADCRFLCGQKAAEKPAPSSEAGGTAQGACGPLKKPRGKKWVVPRIASCNSMEHGLWSALRSSQDKRSPGLPYLCGGPLPQTAAWGKGSRFHFGGEIIPD